MTKIALVSCAKSQHTQPIAAKDLYTSALFRASRRFAERFADDWYILSAAYGLLHPDQVVAPYERPLNTLTRSERQTWVDEMIEQSRATLPLASEVIVLASTHYAEGLVTWLTERGHNVILPLGTLRIGQRIQWLRQQAQPNQDQ
ncbi:DUF6884 domain-containing protein [Ahniella affigens]|nr:DUF6884 domain-containing protein [Ahniella affigens]